jgi:hypothetical protein
MRKFALLTLLFIVAIACPAKDDQKNTLTVRVITGSVKTYSEPYTQNTSITSYQARTTFTETDIDTWTITTQIVEGDGIRYVIQCPGSEIHLRASCVRLIDGDSYQAEIENKTMWVMVPAGKGLRSSPLKDKGKQLNKDMKIKNSILKTIPIPAK